MRRSAIAPAPLGLALLCGLLLSAASGANKAQRQEAASDLVRQALQQELGGKNADRDSLLRSALEQLPDYAPAMWHTGHVRHRNRWLKFDALGDQAAEDLKLKAYWRYRETSPDTLEGHLSVARWCAKKDLPERMRAHLTAVLERDADHAEARRMLGHRQVSGTWLSERDVREAEAQARQTAAAIGQWKPQLEKIREDLSAENARRREVARQRLMAIDEASAIPALELALATESQETALLAIEVLDRIQSPEAALALARQAVFSPWKAVRETAAEELRSRDFEAYVPELLAALQTPIQSRAALYRAPNGRLRYRHVFYREGEDRGHLRVMETEYPLTVLQAYSPAGFGVRAALLDEARRQDAAMKAQLREQAKEQQNAAIRKLNERICQVLSTATRENVPADPERWWQWWNDYNEVYLPDRKPLSETYHRDVVRFADYIPGVDDPPEELPPPDPPVPGARVEVHPSGAALAELDGKMWVKFPGEEWSAGPVPEAKISWLWGRGAHAYHEGKNWYKAPGQEWVRRSCLVAGTKVRTETGLVPIEEIRVGDLVLSQHPGSGQLAYKTVLKTTVRPPVRLFKIVFGERALQCSGGHPFWICGKGWVKARDLEEGTRLHTVEGTMEVRSVHPTGIEATHNLVVEDFHTYFVTESNLLTHDNTIADPTTAVVPGLAKR